MKETSSICIRNGDIYIAVLPDDADGSLQSDIRPVIIVSNNLANRHSPVVTVVPMTSQANKKKLPTHITLNGCGLEKESIVLAEQIMSVNKISLRRKLGSITETAYQEKLKRAIEIQLGL